MTAQLTLICRTPTSTIRLQLAVIPFSTSSTPSRRPSLVLRLSERNMGRGKSVCAFPQSTCPLCPAHSAIYYSLHSIKMHPLLIVLLALLLLLPLLLLLNLSPGFTRLAEMPWLLPSYLMPSMDATQRSLELSTSGFLPESQPWSTTTNARRLFTSSSAIGREISFAKLVFLQLPVRELFCGCTSARSSQDRRGSLHPWLPWWWWTSKALPKSLQECFQSQPLSVRR